MDLKLVHNIGRHNACSLIKLIQVDAVKKALSCFSIKLFNVSCETVTHYNYNAGECRPFH